MLDKKGESFPIQNNLTINTKATKETLDATLRLAACKDTLLGLKGPVEENSPTLSVYKNHI